MSALEEYRALPVGAPRSLTKVKADAAIAELEEEARHHNWVESQVARKATKRAEKAESDVKWLKEKVRLTEAQFVQRTQMWERAETENTRLMRLLDKPFLEKLAELEAENARLDELATKFAAQLIAEDIWDAGGWTPEIMVNLDPKDVA